jgi:putative ABC transport system ATP-binding protein
VRQTGPSSDRAGQPRTLELKDVHVESGRRTVLAGIDLIVKSGIPVGLTGPSGSGKSALCLVVAGVIAPSRGQVLLDGEPFTPDDDASVGLILQDHGLISWLTAEENVALPLQARTMTRDEIADRAARALGSVGLADQAARLVVELSGGERQRVGVARALAADPTVLVADEPTGELDPANRTKILTLLAQHAANSQIVVIASDDPEVMDALPRVVELDEGRVVEVRSGNPGTSQAP